MEETAQPSLEKTKSELIDPHVISKTHDSEGRQTTAATILQVRKEAQRINSDIQIKEDQSEKTSQGLTFLVGRENQKKTDLHSRERSIRGKLMRLAGKVGIEDRTANELHAELVDILNQRTALESQITTLETEIQQLRENGINLPSAKELLQAYYEKMEIRPLTNEEKRRLLRPDVLAALTTEEYIKLWRRLNPYFLSHVTRQGFRDHNAMMYHSGGLQEFHTGLTSVLADERALRPPFAVRDLRTRDPVSVKKYLDDWVLQAEDEVDARDRLHTLLNFTLASAPHYPDKTAVHFAAQIVADSYYGGEAGNEAFFIYPSDVIASHHDFAFNGREKDFTKPQSETKWNDVFVWPENLDSPGIPVDAGLVFLPESTRVDPMTGSKYASEVQMVEGEEKRVMILDKHLMDVFIDWFQNLDDQSIVMQAFDLYKASPVDMWGSRDTERNNCIDIIFQELLKLGFTDDAALSLSRKLTNESWVRSKQQLKLKESLEFILEESGAQWKRAENTISSKEYWENYFIQHPNQRPRHLIYYTGNPTAAVYEFLQRNKIGQADTTNIEGVLLGFDDHYVTNMHEDPRAKRGYDELIALGNKIINEHFRNIK